MLEGKQIHINEEKHIKSTDWDGMGEQNPMKELTESRSKCTLYIYIYTYTQCRLWSKISFETAMILWNINELKGNGIN